MEPKFNVGVWHGLVSKFFYCVNVTWRRHDETQTLMDDLLHGMWQAENAKGGDGW